MASEAPPHNIALTGFMATGKTTVGRIVADVLRMRFVDIDAELVRREGMSIANLFNQKGEPYFRQVEAELCREWAARPNVVMATGGGALINPDTLAQVCQRGLVVCLWASPEAIRARLSGDSGRPLAADWQGLYERRKAAYEAMPHHIFTTGKIPEEVAKEVVTLWRTQIPQSS
jgi:shikimate kinase